MDRSVLLKIINRALRIGGLLPFKLSENKSKWYFLHAIYCYIASTYFCLFVTTQFIELIIAVRSDNYSVLELLNILSVFLLYSIAIVKLKVIRSNPMGKLYDEMYEQEDIILNGEHEEVKEIYWMYIRKCHFMCRCFLMVALCCISSFFITPFIDSKLNPLEELYYVVNGTVIYHPRPLPFVSWLPFDKYKYYKTAYGMHLAAGTFGAAITAICDITFYGMLIYGAGQLVLLQYCFRNFKEITNTLTFSRGFTREYGIVFVVKCLVVLHNKIIRFKSRFKIS